ncbi:MAG: GTP-binding protein [Thermoplasmata archaeon]|nr:MAG: GTP-binding protein [Thermoplasmata archaeon]
MADIKSWKMKVCLIGDAAVGKTSLIQKFVLDRFDERYIATLGTKTTKKTILVNNHNTSYNLTLMIWDILGQKFFEKLQKVAYEGANGAFIVVDLTRKETLESFDRWLFSLFQVAGEIPVVVLANKNDLSQEFGKNEIKELLSDYGFPFYLTSAKTGDNVDCAFHALGESMIDVWGNGGSKSTEIMAKLKKRMAAAESQIRLTPIEAEDKILAMFCKLLGDTDIAMAIIRMQFRRTGVDFRNPTVKGLEKLVEFLIEAVSDRIEPARLEEEKRAYMNVIGRIDKE